jgi:hypothetical protein
MRIKKLTAIRKKTENRIENVRFMRALQQAKNRQTLKTEHAVLHNLIYQQISPGLRDRVLQRGKHIDKLLSNNS